MRETLPVRLFVMETSSVPFVKAFVEKPVSGWASPGRPEPFLPEDYSHSIVAGGLLEMS